MLVSSKLKSYCPKQLRSEQSACARELTICLSARRCSSFANLALLLQVDMPTRALSLLVLQCESENAAALLDGVLPLCFVGLKSVVDDLEGLRSGELWTRETHGGL